MQSTQEQDWGSSSPKSFHTKTLHITKENKIIYLIVTWALALTTVVSVIGIIILSAISKEIPTALVALSSVSVGALGSLFTHK